MERRFFLCLLLTLTALICLPCYSQENKDSLIVALNDDGKYHARLGNFDEAIAAFNAMLALDSTSVEARNNLGITYKLLGRYNDALRNYEKAVELIRAECGPACPELGMVYMNIGIIYNQKNDYEYALQYLNTAENILGASRDHTGKLSNLYNNIGNSYSGKQEWRKALQSYQEGVELKLSMGLGGLGISYANCATAYEKLNELDSASMYYNLSIEEKKREYEGSPTYSLIETYNNYGILLLRMNRNELSLRYQTEALELARDIFAEKHPTIAQCHAMLASWYSQNNDFSKALEHYQGGLNAIVFDYDDTDIYHNPELDNEIISEPLLLEILYGKALTLHGWSMKTGDIEALKASLKTQELANMLAEKMRSTYIGDDSKLLITGQSRVGYERSVRIAVELYELTGEFAYANKAFISAEKSKSAVLLASLQEVEKKKDVGIPAEIQQYEQDLKREKDIFRKKLYEEQQRSLPDSARVVRWQQKLLNLSQKLDSIDNVIREEYPEYASKYDNEVIDLQGVMDGLASGHTLIEYSLSDTCLFVFTIGADDYNIQHLSIGGELHNLIDSLGTFLRDNNFANNSMKEYHSYLRSAYGLYNMVVLPAKDHFHGNKLTIIPDRELGYIPFEALLTEEPPADVMDYRELPYMVYSYRTNYSYSATLLFTEVREQKNEGQHVLAFSPTYENMEEISSEKFPAYRDYSSYLVPLRFISEEIRNISDIMDCRHFDAYDATEKVFKEEAPYYDILHLAMHTLINDENPMYSQLVFTLNNDTVEENDGLLNAYEIFNMRLSARMAVLSACNTGSGKMQKGEGIMSMARGFIYAGVPSIIMTLWAVEDRSGSVLMSKFYGNLHEGMEIDEALQEAKLQYLAGADQLSAHPYLWSGYVSIGKTRALSDTFSGFDFAIILSAVALVAALLLYFLVRRRMA